MEKIPAAVVVGPTASGKTALSVLLAQALNGEIISADSMQIYRGMDIATAKPTAEERRGVPHHLLDFLPPDRPYSVAEFVKDARAAAKDIVSRGRRVIVAGGTGLYVDSLIGHMAFEEEPGDGGTRAVLRERLRAEGAEALYKELASADPEYAATVDPRNTVRVLRALEILARTGEKPSVRRRRAAEQPSDFNAVFIGLTFADRSLLYRRIERRVDEMLERGLVEEARRYFADGAGPTSAQAIGYKELEPYLSGTLTLAEARENLIRATRRYAKRQLTWFRRNQQIRWIVRDGRTEEEIFSQAAATIRESGVFQKEDIY